MARPTNRPLTVAALLCGMFMAAMEMTVVSTAMPTVVGDLGGIRLYSWVFAVYMLASTVTMPIYGKLADLYGRKPVLFVGIALFLAGSMASGQARTMHELIAFRAIQGLGAGAIQPVGLTIVGDLFNIEERARIQGFFGAVWGLAGLAGPQIGALILRVLSWRWIFYVNVPFGLACGLVIAGSLHERIERKRHQLDFAGSALLGISIVALITGARGGELAVPALGISVASFAAFLFAERRAHEPVVPLDLMSTRVMSVSSGAGALLGAAMISTVTFLPLFVQGVLGGTPQAAATAITPMVVTWPIASFTAGHLVARIGFRPLIRGGLMISVLAATLIALFVKPGVSVAVPAALTSLFGVGLGFTNTSLLIAVQTSVEWRQRGVATASTLFFRTIGGAVAVGFMGGILGRALSGDPSVPADAANQLMGPERGARLAPEVLSVISRELSGGIATIFWVVCGIAGLAFLLSWLFPFVPSSSAAAEEPGAAKMSAT